MTRIGARPTPVLVAGLLLVLGACTASSADSLPVSPGGVVGAARVDDDAVVRLPAVVESSPTSQPPTTPHGPVAAVIDVDGRLALVNDGEVRDEWFKWDAIPSPDGSAAVLTLGPHITGIGPERPVTWVSLPGGERLAQQVMATGSELTATSNDGGFAAFTSRAGEPIGDAIAGSRQVSDIEIIARDDGPVFSGRLEGNFVPEAFSRRMTAAGVPALLFLLEYVPAHAPSFYRVRVLSTETGEVSLPLNLRNKVEQVDERMAGFSRSHVVSDEHGLLFTLYRGTVDGTPDGEPYAFVHTLDFGDGVWCLDVDPRLELDELPGSLAVGGDRLYVASANGRVGSFLIPTITDPNRSPTMDWVVQTTATTGEEAPLVTADDEAVYVSPGGDAEYLVRVDAAGEILAPSRLFGPEPQALAWDDGALHAIGPDWSTFPLSTRPDWLGEIRYLVVD
jgi:hypothetical protein